MQTISFWWPLLLVRCNRCLLYVMMLGLSMMLFNASKSKCMFFRPRKFRNDLHLDRPVFYVGGNSLDYVEEWSHLGHLISLDLSDNGDIIWRKHFSHWAD